MIRVVECRSERVWRVSPETPCYVVSGRSSFAPEILAPWTVTPLWPTIPAQEAATQVWPCYVQVAGPGDPWPLCAVDPDRQVLNAKENIERERLAGRVPVTLVPLSDELKVSALLRCPCGHVQSRGRWLLAAARSHWDGCPKCGAAVAMPEPRVRLVEVPAARCYEGTVSARQCPCGCRFELRDWIRFTTTHGGCPECGRSVEEEDLIETLKRRRAMGME